LVWKVIPIIAGEFGMVRDDIKFRGGDSRHSEMVPSYIFLAESKIGKVLIDTSFSTPEMCENELGLAINRTASLEQLLWRYETYPDEIMAVILTHLHWDHASNCDLFLNSKIYCQRQELDAAFASGSDYPAIFLDSIKKSMARVVPLDGDIELFDDFRVVLCGGHTIGSQMIEIETSSGKAIITGDTIMTYQNVEENIPIGLCTDSVACSAALARIRAMQGILLLPSHDYRTIKFISHPEICRNR